MLIRHAHKKEEAFGKEYELFKKAQEKAGNRRPKDEKAVKAHNVAMADKFNQGAKLDRDFLDVSGVSPIRCRHEYDLYGVKSGIGKFNPIMVENINKIPEEEDFLDNATLKKKAAQKEKSAAKGAEKGEKKKEEKAPAKPAEKKPPGKP